VPRPRARILGAGGGGGGPMIDSRGSESEAGEWSGFSALLEPLRRCFGLAFSLFPMALCGQLSALSPDIGEVDRLRWRWVPCFLSGLRERGFDPRLDLALSWSLVLLLYRSSDLSSLRCRWLRWWCRRCLWRARSS